MFNQIDAYRKKYDGKYEINVDEIDPVHGGDGGLWSMLGVSLLMCARHGAFWNRTTAATCLDEKTIQRFKVNGTMCIGGLEMRV